MRDARIEQPFGDGDYSFRLGWGQLIELQEKCGAGPYVVLNRLRAHTWQVEDIAEVIRIGLIGGGMAPVEALKLVKRYVKERPPLENYELAFTVLGAGLMGAPDEPVGTGRKKDAPDEDDDGKLDVAPLYAKGAIMGFTPDQVNNMSIWQFVAAWDGYAKHHSGDKQKMSDKESDELFGWLKAQEDAGNLQ
ncbi:tail tube protein [Rhizobium phage RHph_X2_26]|nr:tail tube protein [Rhizobium phage RHph_X2_26]